MGSHMVTQEVPSSKTSLTFCALKRFFAGVGSHMDSQVGILNERFTTNGAFKRSFAGMDSYVVLE